jgi:hypothetical protein
MDADQIYYRFADDNQPPNQARCRRNQVARQEEPPSSPGRTEQQERCQASRKQADMLVAAANWLRARKRYQQKRGASGNEPAE